MDPDDAPAPDADDRYPDGPDTDGPDGDGPDADDDLAEVSTPLARLGAAARRWLAVLVALALVVPAGAWLVDEIGFLRSGADVVATLDGELAGTDAAAAVLLVRTIGCPGRTGSTGSAFVVETPDGPALVTNRHVVEHAATVGVRALDGSSSLTVTGVRLATSADVAVLEVTDEDRLPPALVLASTPAAAGDPVRLVGFPAATPFTTTGEVARRDGAQLRLDLDVDPGASGSPVVDADGEVVGQVFAVARDGEGVATPTDVLAPAIAEARPSAPC